MRVIGCSVLMTILIINLDELDPENMNEAEPENKNNGVEETEPSL